ncbi:hypothetical protein GCM10029964_069380 [Kibdelosporangium lantanae]
MPDPRRRIPATDRVLAEPALAPALAALGRDLVKSHVVAAQQRARAGALPVEDIVAEVLATLPVTASSLSAVINATGVIVHTNLGRAPLSPPPRPPSRRPVDRPTSSSTWSPGHVPNAAGEPSPRSPTPFRPLRPCTS